MYIRAKRYDNRTYYWLVKAERREGKVKQQHLCYLGRHSTIEDAVAALETRVEETRRLIGYHLNRYWDTKEPYHEQQLEKVHSRYRVLTTKLAKLKAFEEEM